ncbi:Oidioi.mRNA.OKI2018_I69.XSR.g15569.t1.cds [Oikopleura dioica]|uniref:Oidioi.mRNA.OKI2018_I69.XSR.g15569.t1.cds n=1 Tax=Oikopleura dioica TaxID=34765 RepID=A0ABN7SIE9_OIKDI|nr:Oidioi.mRNA.OKI2018_I69.XSR.g15569.t1.cds [Oikopleura dioica]
MSSTAIKETEKMITTMTKTISEKDLSTMLSQPDLFTSTRTKKSTTSIRSLRRMSSRMKVAPKQTMSLQFYPSQPGEDTINAIADLTSSAVPELTESQLEELHECNQSTIEDEKKISCCCFL